MNAAEVKSVYLVVKTELEAATKKSPKKPKKLCQTTSNYAYTERDRKAIFKAI